MASSSPAQLPIKLLGSRFLVEIEHVVVGIEVGPHGDELALGDRLRLLHSDDLALPRHRGEEQEVVHREELLVARVALDAHTLRLDLHPLRMLPRVDGVQELDRARALAELRDVVRRVDGARVRGTGRRRAGWSV